MQKLVLFLIVVVTTFGYFASGDKWGRGAFLPNEATYLPELLGVVALALVIVAGTRNRFQFVRPVYWVVFGVLAFTTLCGVLVNNVESGPIFAGIRNYLRAIPWFFIPAAFAFSGDQIKRQLWLLFGIGILQLPLAVEQRIKSGDTSRGVNAVTGDWTVGTFGLSSILSLFLICAIFIAVALYIRKFISGRQFLIAFLLLAIPTTINETKGSLVFLPIGLLIVFAYAAKQGARVRYLLSAAGLLTLFLAIYVPIYDYLIADRAYGVTIGELVTDQDKLQAYLQTDSDIGTSKGQAGRADSVTVPLRSLAKDPVHLMFGFGIGNVSDSSLGPGFVGEHFPLFRPFLVTAFARIVLELGVLGIALLLIVYWLIFNDARMVARRDESIVGALAAGWTGVTVIMAIAMFYKDITIPVSLSYLFWYFSGLVAAARMRLTTVFNRREVFRPVEAAASMGIRDTKLRIQRGAERSSHRSRNI